MDDRCSDFVVRARTRSHVCLTLAFRAAFLQALDRYDRKGEQVAGDGAALMEVQAPSAAELSSSMPIAGTGRRIGRCSPPRASAAGFGRRDALQRAGPSRVRLHQQRRSAEELTHVDLTSSTDDCDPASREQNGTLQRSRFAIAFLASMWVTFWIGLFLLGVREHRWQGSGDLWQLSSRYLAASLICTAIGLSQLARAQRVDQLLVTPLEWFLFLWRWLPVEATCFAVGVFAIPRGIMFVFGHPYDDRNWLENEAYDVAKFLLFYFLAGGIQFGIHAHWAWYKERLRASQGARLVQEAQLRELTQQLQPHFLFNGINLISSLIHSEPDLADRLLGRLATLLRAATGAARNAQQPLETELALLRAFAEIMVERYPDRVVLTWRIGEGISHCLVPTFGLQPLLENCFRHVVEKRSATTHIVVRALRVRDRLRIQVEDDGDHRQDIPVLGVGLSNLNHRLRALHGTRATLDFIPRSTNGLVVRVELPCAS